VKDRTRTLFFLCGCLSPAGTSEDTDLIAEAMRRDEVSWEILADLASYYLVAPTLWTALSAKGLIGHAPEDFAEYLSVVHDANLERNRAIKTQVEQTVRLLNSCGVEPAPLKGAALLLTGPEENLGSRMMIDIDLLVSQELLEVAARRLREEGYVNHESAESAKGCQHLPPMVHPAWPASIELHEALSADFEPEVAPARDLWEQARLVEQDGCRFRLLSPNQEIIHNIFHSEIHHEYFLTHTLDLRHLLDFAQTCMPGGDNVDLKHVRGVFAEHGVGKIVDAYLYRAHRLFGVPGETGVKAQSVSVRHFERAVKAKRWDELTFLEKAGQNLSLMFSATRIRARYGCSEQWADLFRCRSLYAMRLARRFLMGKRRSLVVGLLSAQDEERRATLKEFDGGRQ
jgi:hypothetical protein